MLMSDVNTEGIERQLGIASGDSFDVSNEISSIENVNVLMMHGAIDYVNHYTTAYNIINKIGNHTSKAYLIPGLLFCYYFFVCVFLYFVYAIYVCVMSFF